MHFFLQGSFHLPLDSIRGRHFGDIIRVLIVSPVDGSLGELHGLGHCGIDGIGIDQIARPDLVLLFHVFSHERAAMEHNELVFSSQGRLAGKSALRKPERKSHARRGTKPGVPKPKPKRGCNHRAHARGYPRDTAGHSRLFKGTLAFINRNIDAVRISSGLA